MLSFKEYFKEDAPTNCAGSGAVAGIGVGDHGEPPGNQAVIKKKSKKSQVLKRRILTSS